MSVMAFCHPLTAGAIGRRVTSPAPASEPTSEPTKPRGASRQTWHSKRTYRAPWCPTDAATFGMAWAWVLPWTRDAYPGIGRGLVQLLGKRWHPRTLQRWRSGQQRARPDVLLALAAEIEARCKRGAEIAEALRAEADAWRPADRSHNGFLAIDPETGRNKRWRG